MTRRFVIPFVASALLAVTAKAQKVSEFKSPGPGMHFSDGMPIVVFLDLLDGPGSGFGTIEDTPNGPVGWPQGQVLIDGTIWTDRNTGLDKIPGPMTRNDAGNPVPVDFYRFEAGSVATMPPCRVQRVKPA